MKRLFLMAAGLLPACFIFAQTAHTLLWRVSGNDLTRPSYLFGTMHILCAEDAMLSDSLKAVIASVDKVYFEINLSDMTGMLSSLQYMQMNEGRKLSDLLTQAEYLRVKDYFAKHAAALPFGMLERFKPMLVSGLIEEEGLGCATTDGMEMQIMKEFRPYHRPIDGLETVAFQARLFDSIPYKDQARELVKDIDSAAINKKMTRDLAELYKKQDLDQIDALSRKSDPGLEQYMDLLLYDRNRKWVKALPSLFSGQSLLIAVGAAHLPGANGVISLLQRQGYTVTPVKNQPVKGP
jgi:uncharacterized protein